jgi:hypothetical protein
MAGALIVLAGLLYFLTTVLMLPGVQLRSYERHPVSQGVQNIVKRGYQMTEISWTPQRDLTAWDGLFTYEAGVTYKGLPYGQPRDGCYIPWELDYQGFLDAVADPDSMMYTNRASFVADAPYYSCDCSSFVCWAWALPDHRLTTHVPDLVEELPGAAYTDVQVGDVLWYPLHHTILISDILYDRDDRIVAIEISESSAKRAAQFCAARVWFGEGSNRSLADFEEKYFTGDSDYTLYRLRDPEAVVYTHDCAVPLPGDVCEICGYGMNPSGGGE